MVRQTYYLQHWRVKITCQLRAITQPRVEQNNDFNLDFWSSMDSLTNSFIELRARDCLMTKTTVCWCPARLHSPVLNVPADSCAGSFRRRCSLSRSESSCFLCAWMLLHVSDMTSWSTRQNKNPRQQQLHVHSAQKHWTVKSAFSPKEPQMYGPWGKLSGRHRDWEIDRSGALALSKQVTWRKQIVLLLFIF